MSLNKTALKKMKKDELVEHILKIQKEQATSALLSGSDEEASTEGSVDEAQEWKKMWEEAIAERNMESQLRSAESEKNARDMTKWTDLAADLKKKVDELERNLCGSLSLCCDCCQSSITEDEVNTSIEERTGNFSVKNVVGKIRAKKR